MYTHFISLYFDAIVQACRLLGDDWRSEERCQVVKYMSRCKDGCSYGKVNAFALQLCEALSALPFRTNHGWLVGGFFLFLNKVYNSM